MIRLEVRTIMKRIYKRILGIALIVLMFFGMVIWVGLCIGATFTEMFEAVLAMLGVWAFMLLIGGFAMLVSWLLNS